MRTQNKEYELPAAEHDVLEDLNKINETLEAIDEDISAVETAASHLLTNVNDIVNLGVHTDQLQNTTVDDIAANGYLVVSSDGSKLQTIEGGGDAGGNTHEVLVKKSDKNYDTEWKNLFKVGKELKPVSVAGNSNINSNNSVILSEDVVDCTSNVAFSNNQIKTDYELELNNSYILTNNAENVPQIESKKATMHNLGIVKIGNGIDVENGSISVFGGGDATKLEFGTVQPGAGFSLDDGTLSFDGYDVASASKAGILKVGSDFTINENGELEMIVAGDPIIYNLGKIKEITGTEISVERDICVYRKSIDTDTDFTIVLNNFTQTKDMAFYVELVASRLCKVTFNGGDEFFTLRGTNLYKISKMLGDNQVSVELIKAEGQMAELLTTNTGQEVNRDYYVTSSTNRNSAIKDWIYNTTNTGSMAWHKYPRQIDFVFLSPVIVDYLWWRDDTFDEQNPLTLEGSLDGTAWQTILASGGATDSTYRIKATSVGQFKYYRLKWSGERQIHGFALFGYRLAETQELVRALPIMTSTTMEEVELTGSGTVDVKYSIASNTDGKWVANDSNTGTSWLQYYFPNGVVANCVEILSTSYTYGDGWGVAARYNQLLQVSNDGSSWVTLLSVAGDSTLPGDHSYAHRVYEFSNNTSYKYYKFSSARNNNVIFTRFILYRRESVE